MKNSHAMKKSSMRIQKWRVTSKYSFWFWMCWVARKSFLRKTLGEDVPLLALTSIMAFLDDSSSSSLLMSCAELCFQQCWLLFTGEKWRWDHGWEWTAFNENESLLSWSRNVCMLIKNKLAKVNLKWRCRVSCHSYPVNLYLGYHSVHSRSWGVLRRPLRAARPGGQGQW